MTDDQYNRQLHIVTK